MIGIIAEVISFFEQNEEATEKNQGSILYSNYCGGAALDIREHFSERKEETVLITKISTDEQGRLQQKYLIENEGMKDEDILSSPLPSAVSIDGSLLIRSTAPQSLKECEITPLIQKYDIDSLVISSSLLSFSPVKDEIIKALEKNRERIKAVVVNASEDTRILLLEELRDSIKEISRFIQKCMVMGDALSIEGTERLSSEYLTECFRGVCSES